MKRTLLSSSRKWLLTSYLKKIKRLIRRSEADTSLRETIEELIEENSEAIPSIESDERLLLGNVLNLRDLTSHDIMTPRADMIAVADTISRTELIDKFIETGISWLVVYKHTLDNVIGMIHARDLLPLIQKDVEFTITAFLKEVMFVSPAMRTLDLLLMMKKSAIKIAIVVDEYGGVDGLVTFSQLIEEIIGDIEDNSNLTPVPQLNWRSDGAVLADGRCSLDELDDLVDDKLNLIDKNDDIETLSGLVVHLAGRVPSRGEIICHKKGYEFEVLDADPRYVKRVCIHNLNHRNTSTTLRVAAYIR